MVKINPFCGYYPNKKYADKVTCLPYDVFSREEAFDIVQKNPISFLNVVKPESNFALNIDPDVEIIHQTGLKNFNKFVRDELLFRSSSPSFYIYRQKMGSHIQTGIVAGASINEYSSGIIKRHELTKEDKERDRTFHINIMNANTGSVFLVHNYNKKLHELIDSTINLIGDPYINFVSHDDNVINQLWLIEDIDVIETIKSIYNNNINCMYIADGHHRAAAARRVQQIRMSKNKFHNGEESYNYFLATIFSDNDLNIMDYNRVIKDLNGLDVKDIIEKISKKFKIYSLGNYDLIKPNRINEFSMYLNGKWHKLIFDLNSISSNAPDVDLLDASILQNNILGPIFNIDNPRTNSRIDYVGGIKGLDELVRRCNKDCKIAFALYPITASQIINISDKNELVPPKSTWFEPKLRSGMVTRILD